MYDIAVVGAGIVGLAHALAAARKGLRVVVLERNSHAVGASIRNFGLVTVTGQKAGREWQLARRSRDIWDEIAGSAGISILQRGMALAVRRESAVGVLESFLETDMGEGCTLLSGKDCRDRLPGWAGRDTRAALISPHERRINPRDALPALARWLEQHHDVTFRWNSNVSAVEPPFLETSNGPVRAARAVICPGDDFSTLAAGRFAALGIRKCQLHMLRARPASTADMPMPLMSDLTLTRYPGYQGLPGLDALMEDVEADQPAAVAHGVHLIVVQNADRSLVIGDSHHYGATPQPFYCQTVEDQILGEYRQATGQDAPMVLERWLGTYASLPDRHFLVDSPSETLRTVLVTSGCGMSIAFGLAEMIMEEWN